jgi:hypothetical protein
MTNPKGMDELLWGREFEDVHDWAERLKMATKVGILMNKSYSK